MKTCGSCAYFKGSNLATYFDSCPSACKAFGLPVAGTRPACVDYEDDEDEDDLK